MADEIQITNFGRDHVGGEWITFLRITIGDTATFVRLMDSEVIELVDAVAGGWAKSARLEIDAKAKERFESTY